MDFGAVLPVEYESEKFKALDYAGQTITGKTFYACQFLRSDFKETHWVKCKFNDCVFTDCDLSLASFKDCSFSETRFEDCKLIGINWTDAIWDKRGILNSIHFTRCGLSHSTFAGLILKKLTLTYCTARDVDFAETDLTRANCSHTDFAESRFFHTNLTEADFRHATNYTIPASLNTLKKTQFSLPEAMALLYSLDIVLSEA